MQPLQQIHLELPEDTLRAITKRIRKWRLRNGWTQHQLAHRASIPYGTYRHFERTGQISLRRFIYLVHALGFQNELANMLPKPVPRTLSELTSPPRQRGIRSDATHHR